MESNTTNPTHPEVDQVINSHAVVPDINNYLTPLTQDSILALQIKIETVLKTFKNKIDDKSSLIIAKEEEIETKGSEFANIPRVSNYDDPAINEKYNFMLDCLGFIHRENANEIKTFDKVTFKHLLNQVNDKGIVAYLMDYHHLIKLPLAINEVIKETNVNLLVKLYIVEKAPLVGLLYVQKFEGSACNSDNLKLLSYEIYEDNTMTKPISYLVKDIPKSLVYMNEMYQYQGYLHDLHPGTVLKVNVKENFWSENIDFTLTIVDSEDEELKAKKTCAAIIVSKAYASDFIYLTKEGNMQLCRQVNASRMILIRPNAFNFDSVTTIKDKISHYILLFKFGSCVDSSIPILTFSDTKYESFVLYNTDKFTIRDMIENEKKETFRQLIFHDAPNEVQSEIKLILTSKSKAKSDNTQYSVLPTIDKYKEKNFVSCLDKNFICSFYIKCLLCGGFFINAEEFPKTNLEVLVLGAGIGSVNHYFDRVFRSKVNITSVEIDKVMPEIGQKYFGFKNFDKENFKWVYGDAKHYLMNSKDEAKFDMVISDINNTNMNDGISPPPVFFEIEILNSIKNSLKDTGVYIINLMSRSYRNYNLALEKLESVFENIFIVENNEDLNKIHYCFKKKFSNDEYLKIYKDNLENFTQNIDMSIIENDYKKILKKVIDLTDIKPKLK